MYFCVVRAFVPLFFTLGHFTEKSLINFSKSILFVWLIWGLGSLVVFCQVVHRSMYYVFLYGACIHAAIFHLVPFNEKGLIHFSKSILLFVYSGNQIQIFSNPLSLLLLLSGFKRACVAFLRQASSWQAMPTVAPSTKVQLISKCLFGVFDFFQKRTKTSRPEVS